jgi:hypothetical protein
MTRLACELVVCANSQHVYQVISGFLMLQRVGVVDVSLRYDERHRAHLPTSHLAELRLAGGVTIAYDMLDGYNFADPERLNDYLASVDVYFKRSFNPNYHAGIANASRILPFGLNYPVTVRHPFFLRLGATSLEGLPRSAVRMLLRPWLLDATRFEDVPRQRGDPQILFQTQTWDPAEADVQSDHGRREREEMNELRAACVRLLRQEFGHRFRGGFVPTAHARKHFPDCLLDRPEAASKRRFMQALKQADICVATTGLHESNGWSLGEYVAGSKAVVAQHLSYTVPAFTEGRNYLGFATAGECVDRASDLASDPERLRKMQVENYAYYHRFLRPDRLVLNSLLVAMRR